MAIIHIVSHKTNIIQSEWRIIIMEKKTKTAAKKAEEVVEKVQETVKTEAKKAEKAVKETAKKAETAVKKAVAPKETVYVQFAGSEVDVKALVDAAKAEFKANNTNAKIADLKVYVKPEEHAAYYVVNGDVNGKVCY